MFSHRRQFANVLCYLLVSILAIGCGKDKISEPPALEPGIHLIGNYDSADSLRFVFVQEDYAYLLGDGSELEIIDISDPANPTPEGAYHCPEYIHSLFVSGHYAYLAAGSLYIVNIVDPANPLEIGGYDTQYLGDVFVEDSYAYLAHHSGLTILDIAIPSNPIPAGYCQLPGGSFGVFIAGDFAYTISYILNSGIIDIINISDPSNPTRTGAYGENWEYITDIFVVGYYAYTANYGMAVIDITDPETPIIIGRYTGQARRLFIESDYSYIAGGYEDSLKIVDISDPANPVLAAIYDTPGTPSDIFVANGYIYLADGESGLLILQFIL